MKKVIMTKAGVFEIDKITSAQREKLRKAAPKAYSRLFGDDEPLKQDEQDESVEG